MLNMEGSLWIHEGWIYRLICETEWWQKWNPRGQTPSRARIATMFQAKRIDGELCHSTNSVHEKKNRRFILWPRSSSINIGMMKYVDDQNSLRPVRGKTQPVRGKTQPVTVERNSTCAAVFAKAITKIDPQSEHVGIARSWALHTMEGSGYRIMPFKRSC